MKNVTLNIRHIGFILYPPYDDQLGGAGAKYEHKDNKGNNQQWLALSRPLNKDFWDDLPTKHMSYYLDLHIERFCFHGKFEMKSHQVVFIENSEKRANQHLLQHYKKKKLQEDLCFAYLAT